MSDDDKNSEDIMWVVKTRNGSQAAFTCIVEKYQRPVCNLCYHMLKDGGEAEDAAQEVFVRVYTKLNSFDESRKFSTWLYAIASHYCLDKLRQRRCNLVPLDDLVSEFYIADSSAPQPEAALLHKEQHLEIRRLLATLPPDYRILVLLKYWQTMSYDEMADTLNTTVGAIKSKLFRARKTLAKALVEQNAPRRTPIRRSAFAAIAGNI